MRRSSNLLSRPNRTAPLMSFARPWAIFVKEQPFIAPWCAWDTDLKKTLKADEQNRSDIVLAREQWLNTQAHMDAGRLVFIDESAAKTNMTRLRGRSKHGNRCFAFAPHGHWSTTTMISSIRLDGSTQCLAIQGGTTKEVFREYISSILCPVLHPGDVVIVDNLSAHKDAKVKELIENRGASIVFLPAYSPDLNPIEKMWSKVKEKLRSLAPRTYEDLIKAIGTALRAVTPQDAKGWFRSCGYMAV